MLPAPPPEPTHAAGDLAYCARMLPKVSRTFALTIRLLGPQLREQVMIAYLLCRIADTCEDTAELAVGDKRRLLAHLSACLDQGGPDATPLREAFAALRTSSASPRIADEALTEDADRVLRAYRRQSPAVQAAIRPWIQEMCAGMADFAARQAAAEQAAAQARAHAAAGSGAPLIALDDVADLDRYCYIVAGTVGHLLTALFRLYHPRLTRRHAERLTALATSFGLGLQLTNIIKDVADDRRRGWSFIPRQLCALAGITPEQLSDPAHAAGARRVMEALIAKTRRHLDDALAYSCALPRSAYRTRLFCLVPLFFAIRTLSLAARDPLRHQLGRKLKITRGEVYRTICTTYLVAPNNHLARAYYRQLARKPAR